MWPPSRSRSGCLGEGGTLKGRETKQPSGQSCAVPKMYWPFSTQCCDYRERLCWPQNYLDILKYVCVSGVCVQEVVCAFS